MLKNKKTIISMIIIVMAFSVFVSYNVFFRNDKVEALSK